MRYPSIVRPLFVAAAAVILMAGMRFAAAVVVPLLLGAFFAALLYPVYRGLQRRRVPAILALLLTGALLVGVALFLVFLVGASVTRLSADLASYSSSLSQQQGDVQAQLGKVSQGSVVKQIVSALDPATLLNIVQVFLSALVDIAGKSLVIFVVTVFLLLEAAQFAARMRQAFGADHGVTIKSVALFHTFIRYFGLRTIVNAITGAAMTVILWLLGIDDPLLWGVLMFFMSYIPYIGIMIAIIPPVILGYAEYGLGMAVLIIVLTVIVNGAAENIVSPIIMGKGLSVSPTVVFLSFLLWMWLMGASAALIAMPLTVAVLMVLGSFEETRRWAAMMATIPEPPTIAPSAPPPVVS